MKRLMRALATMFGIVYFAVAPATAASAVLAIFLYLTGTPSSTGFLIILPILFFCGVYLSGKAEVDWGRDSGKIVIDEAAGFLVAIAFLQVDSIGGSGKVLILAFFLFRFYDIVKHLPARWSKSLPGGWGVMVDDIIAGIYANASIRILHWLFWSSGPPH